MMVLDVLVSCKCLCWQCCCSSVLAHIAAAWVQTIRQPKTVIYSIHSMNVAKHRWVMFISLLCPTNAEGRLCNYYELVYTTFLSVEFDVNDDDTNQYDFDSK